MDACAPVSRRTSTGTPFNTLETLHFLPTSLATATGCLGVKWLANTKLYPHSTHKRYCVSRCSIAWQSLLRLLQWSFWYLCLQYRTALQSQHCLKTWSFPATLTTNAFLGLGVLMRVGYFLSRSFSPHLFPEPALSPPLFFFRQPRAQWSLLPLMWQWSHDSPLPFAWQLGQPNGRQYHRWFWDPSGVLVNRSSLARFFSIDSFKVASSERTACRAAIKLSSLALPASYQLLQVGQPLPLTVMQARH